MLPQPVGHAVAGAVATEARAVAAWVEAAWAVVAWAGVAATADVALISASATHTGGFTVLFRAIASPKVCMLVISTRTTGMAERLHLGITHCYGSGQAQPPRMLVLRARLSGAVPVGVRTVRA
ncbi:hypothetical protein SSP24_29760 [Streptomyces spinoverrucosus]|uniref:Uncharacterized protein n=1 Tax=Streptomyces spinoverrucosus TaxID=284043 RepID=A0A4Y3VI27_9ACTN|nr:hypothetical protein SSP24_29760 [Streptomyces spinoverrucosus]GHB79133.1 hypothetical protein GCM10010397_57290 [Streptomyces spinoverrucosus]